MKEKDFQKDIILYKNNKYKELRPYKKIKSSKVKSILYYLKSNLYGYQYLTISPKIYNRLKKIKNIKLSYTFLDGALIDDYDIKEENILVKNLYYYDDIRDLLSKLEEISLCELCLNENFWMFDCYYLYIFDNMKITFMYNNKKYKFTNIQDFYKFIYKKEYNKVDFVKRGLYKFRNKKYSILSELNIDNKSKLKKFINNEDRFMYKLSSGNQIYIDVDPKFFIKYKSLEIKTNLYVNDLDGTEECNITDTYIMNNIRYNYEKRNIILLYMIAYSPIINDNLESSYSSLISYTTKNKIVSINGNKINKKKQKFKKIFKKYFKGTSYSLL